MKKGSFVLLACARFFALHASAANARNNIGIKSAPIPAPSLSDVAEETATSNGKFTSDEQDAGKRGPSSTSSQVTGSEDLMSPELKAFRDKLVKTRHAEQLEPLLREYDA